MQHDVCKEQDELWVAEQAFTAELTGQSELSIGGWVGTSWVQRGEVAFQVV